MEKKIYVSSRKLLGAVAKWAVEQSPYPRPENLEKVLDALYGSTKEDFARENLGFKEFESAMELEKYLREHLQKIPEYMAWNERKNGNQSAYKFTSRFDGPGDPDDDFIDIWALEGNAAAEIVCDQVD